MYYCSCNYVIGRMMPTRNNIVEFLFNLNLLSLMQVCDCALESSIVIFVLESEVIVLLFLGLKMVLIPVYVILVWCVSSLREWVCVYIYNLLPCFVVFNGKVLCLCCVCLSLFGSWYLLCARSR